jgi:hypothetical protein
MCRKLIITFKYPDCGGKMPGSKEEDTPCVFVENGEQCPDGAYSMWNTGFRNKIAENTCARCVKTKLVDGERRKNGGAS